MNESKDMSNCKEKGAKNSIEVECINGCLSMIQVDYLCKNTGKQTVRLMNHDFTLLNFYLQSLTEKIKSQCNNEQQCFISNEGLIDEYEDCEENSIKITYK